MAVTDEQVDQATRDLIQTLLRVQFIEDWQAIVTTPYRSVQDRQRLKTHLQWEYQALGLANVAPPLTELPRAGLRGSRPARGGRR